MALAVGSSSTEEVSSIVVHPSLAIVAVFSLVDRLVEEIGLEAFSAVAVVSGVGFVFATLPPFTTDQTCFD
jgi:hypothetical protein